MSDEESAKYRSFIDSILESPPRWSIFGHFADWLADHGQADLEAAYRWCVAKKAKPYPPRDADYGVWLLGEIETETKTDMAKGLYGNVVYREFASRRNKANAATFGMAMNLLADILKEFRESMG